MAGNNFVASIDIGTEKIALLAADIEDDEAILELLHIIFAPLMELKKAHYFLLILLQEYLQI